MNETKPNCEAPDFADPEIFRRVMSSDIDLCRQVIRTFAPDIDTENLQYVNIGDSILLGDGKKYVCLALATNPDEMNRLQTGIRKQIMEQHRKETGRQK